MRIGHGYDAHRLVRGRSLIIGGVLIPFEYGLLGHSDADVLLHAICDSLLGAAALGDIGTHFPSNDLKYKDIDSRVLLRETVALLNQKKFNIINIDATVIAQNPRLSTFILQMRKNISEDCKINLDNVNVKSTTEEGMGFTGGLEGISAHSVCLIE